MALGAAGKSVAIPIALLLLIPALMVLAAGMVIVAVIALRTVHRAIFAKDDIAVCRLERLLKVAAAAMADVVLARQRRSPARTGGDPATAIPGLTRERKG